MFVALRKSSVDLWAAIQHTNEAECVAPLVALFLSPPEKVQRADGQKVKTAERVSTVREIKEILKVLVRKDFLLM